MTHNQAAMIEAHKAGRAMAERHAKYVTPASISELTYLAHITAQDNYPTYDEQSAFLAGYRGERIRLASWRQFAH